MDRTVSMIKSYMNSIETGERKVIDFHQPQALKEMFDFSLPTGWSSDEKILESMQAVLDKSVATMHPRFFNQLYAGANVYSTMAEWITSVLNTSMYTYEVGPLFTLMEEYVYECLAKQVWWEGHIDGMMLPWWSNSNLNAMQMARYAHNPELHKSGLYGNKKLYVLTSDESHYSITKSAMLMGLGKDAVVKVKTNEQGQMDVDELEAIIHQIREEWGEVFMINATSGTTVLGAYDPIRKISELGKKYEIRVHVDMIWWGTVMFDNTLKEKIDGIELVDSFARNPHKMMWASMQCSVWMTQRPWITASCNVLKTQYLFANDKGYGVGCDTGDKYSQCGRRVDVLKLRLMRKSLGQKGIAANTRKAFADAQYFVQKVNDTPELYLYQEPQCTNICFWYIPSDLTLPWTSHEANLATIKNNYHRIHTITAKIKDRMLEKGEMMVNYAYTKWYPNFFRMITISPKVKKEDLDFVASHIVELGREIE